MKKQEKNLKELIDLCQQNLEKHNLISPKYQKRLRWELEEISAKNKFSYFWNIYDKKIKYPKNENNLLTCWLLGIVPDFDIDKEPHCKYGEFPDIDIDYLPAIRDYIKNVWAPAEFGSEYVCNICNYTTFGIKSSLLDMARVHGLGRDEVQTITKNLDSKDEEGKVLTWDMAMTLYPELKDYCEKFPDVAKAAKKLLNRNRGTGVHAGGLIIASRPLHDLVPLIKRKDAPQASAWVEGLHGQDLQPVGLVKFDLLVISNLLQIARCCEMVKTRYKLDGIFNRPGESDWTDVPKWRNDPKALAMANAGDMKCIFQFDGEGIRSLVRQGGVDRFEDLVAYAALFRPGPLGMKMQERYVERKRGREKYSLHPLLQPVLGKTYGVMVYQEQIMRILNVVGDIPLEDCELVRKAISKKKIEGFIEYKEKFIINGKKNLGWNDEQMKAMWDQIEAFAEYGFNLSHAVAYTYISQCLLCLKAHYPHEFYASILSCETLSEKIKEYKMEAKQHGIDMHRLDINKSKANFELKDDIIYFGVSNVKGIGEGPAKRIVENQPYKSFEDFLFKFGTDATVLKRLIGLRCFRDRDPVTLWKFAESYKDFSKKSENKNKTHAAALARYEEEFLALVPDKTCNLSDLDGDNPFDAEEWKIYDKDDEITVDKEVKCNELDEGAYGKFVMTEISVEGAILQREILKYYRKAKVKRVWNRWKELRKVWQKRKKSIERQRDIDRRIAPSLAAFNADEHEIEEDLMKEFRDPIECEKIYYGFAWVHELERSPDYKGGMTFDALKNDIDTGSGPVELCVKKVTRTKSKKGNDYFQVLAEDATGQENRLYVWMDDWNWWEAEFAVGNLLRVRLQPPSGGFNTFLIESNQVGKWRQQKKYLDKSEDPRVFVMRRGQKEEEKFLTDDEALEQFSNCVMEKI